MQNLWPKFWHIDWKEFFPPSYHLIKQAPKRTVTLFSILGDSFTSHYTIIRGLLYTSQLAAVHTNNDLSPFFQFQCGTKQGCPLSPLLFAVAIEPRAAATFKAKKTDVEGIQRSKSLLKKTLCNNMFQYISHPLSSLLKLMIFRKIMR